MADAIECFGPFALDRDRRQLRLRDQPLFVTDRHLDVLLALTRKPGVIISKRHLIETAWRGAGVTPNSVYRAIKDLRETLGVMPDGGAYIETHNGRGFRFAAPITRVPSPAAATSPPDLPAGAVNPAVPPASPAPLPGEPERDGVGVSLIERLLAPHLASMTGRSALESFSAPAIARARAEYERLVIEQPNEPRYRVGLATACMMLYEATRADDPPDLAALSLAETQARMACRKAPECADAWAVLAHAIHRQKKYQPATGTSADDEDVAAAREAIRLEPEEWRHRLLLAFVSGGRERLIAALSAARKHPGLLIASWFIASVYVARVALVPAREELQRACDALDAQQGASTAFGAIGLHLLLGLVMGADDELDGADARLAREIESAPGNHLFARESTANGWYARGALAWRAGHRERAIAALKQALVILPSHFLARVVLAAITGDGSPELLARIEAGQLTIGPTEAALVHAVILSLQGRHEEAAGVCERALQQQRTGPGALWLIAVEPILNIAARPHVWARVIARLQQLSA